ncbi:MAG: substrate-binding domain-containing protein [Rhodospirillales bacterium]|nr:substrate-binding domain-containing protein [Rhodospirillales bacterium]
MPFFRTTTVCLARSATRLTVCAALFAIVTSFAMNGVRAEEIRIGGTGAALANIERLADTFAGTQPGTTVKVMPGLGSSGGIRALLAGALDVAVSALPAEYDEGTEGLVSTAYARTPFVFATRMSSVTGFTEADLVRVYAGEITAWPDKTPIRLVLRSPTDSDTHILQAMSDAMRRAVDLAYERPGVIVAQTDQTNADALESVLGAIGTSTLGQIVAEHRPLRALAVNGVDASVGEMDAGRYRLVKTLYLVTRSKASPLVHSFVSFVKSDAAQPILSEQGYTPDKSDTKQ